MSSLLFFLAILSFAAADFCPKDTVTDRARLKCYKFINTQRNFTEAKNLCKEFGGNIANLPNDTGLLQKVKEITRQDPCYFWVANARSNCVLALNGKYPQEVSNCSIVASFLCEFEPTCSSTSYFGNPTTRYVSTTATTRTVPVANHPCQNTEIGGDMAALPNETILVEQIKEHARLDKCYFWSTSLQSKKCVLVLNWKYREEIKDCSVPASFLCEFEPRCPSTSYFGSTTEQYTASQPLTAGGPVTSAKPTEEICPTIDSRSRTECYKSITGQKWVEFNGYRYLFVSSRDLQYRYGVKWETANTKNLSSWSNVF
ncbi:hypothetical protein QR680_018618 [Steinernema hermaphroditum]|uniref:C-type lectin domain-containing protein n=1 Tax=Steinernema hermaphroditum TaxID=289476 RepID=A0AA39HKV0_9BILA|nr:hypothetical protein QR680_018618 [Steinernema hermaphroditum]